MRIKQIGKERSYRSRETGEKRGRGKRRRWDTGLDYTKPQGSSPVLSEQGVMGIPLIPSSRR